MVENIFLTEIIKTMEMWLFNNVFWSIEIGFTQHVLEPIAIVYTRVSKIEPNLSKNQSSLKDYQLSITLIINLSLREENISCN